MKAPFVKVEATKYTEVGYVGKDVEGMIRDKCAETADNCVLDELTIADLDADSIRRYRMYFSK